MVDKQHKDSYTRAGHILVVVLVIYGVLVATHGGEFWPFSIHQMFSSAGHPWTRVLVRDVARNVPDNMLWRPASLETLQGRPVPLNKLNLSQNDLSVFVEETSVWSQEHRAVLMHTFRPYVSPDRRFLIYRVIGSLSDTGAVQIQAYPVGLVTPDSLLINPGIYH